MKIRIKLVLVALLTFLFPDQSSAQVMTASSNTFYFNKNSLLIVSDSNTRSAFLCNILADRAGNQSPLIGTGSWEDKGKEVQVSSLLYFDLSSINYIHPNDILRAWLLMAPIHSNLAVFNQEFARIRIRRVLEKWEDSSATWSTQPAVTSQYSYSYSLKKPDTSNFYRFNVTRLIRQMKKSGNFGFEISFNETENKEEFGRLYYSPKVGESELRPMLIIEVADDIPIYHFYTNSQDQQPYNFHSFNQQMPMYDRQQIVEYMKEPIISTTPVTPIPAPPPPPKKSEN